ncbi:MAG: hypothetical protein KBT03_13735 [Bacteroidales bacterium]|nr:hypothetical protein [Candidatus Scybalousia scybalohippi]
MVKKIYRGNTLIYQVGFDSFTVPAGVTNQQFVIPYNVSKIHIDCVASKGNGNNGGKGGRVQCDLSVTGGQILYITSGAQASGNLSAPSYNASDIRINGTEMSDRIIVAGGGGNQANSGAVGGAGGGLTGANGGNGYGGNSAGKGGTQTAGGSGGAGTPVSVGHYHNGNVGTFGLGGAGSYEGSYEGPSGAGGAGWYGGGSGAGDWNKNGAYTAGGGGGSSYTHPTLCSNVVHTQGFNNGNGYIVVSFVE